MVLGAGLALLLLAPAQERVTSEDQAVEIADAFRLWSIKRADGSQTDPPLKPLLSVYLDEETKQWHVDYGDGWVWIRAADGRVAAAWIHRGEERRPMEWLPSLEAERRARYRVTRAIEHLGYTDVRPRFLGVRPHYMNKEIDVDFQIEWRGLLYGAVSGSATLDEFGERLRHWSLGLLFAPPTDTTVAVDEADAERTMLAKMEEVYGEARWTKVGMEKVVFRVRGAKRPHIFEAHGWGWETGPPSVVTWRGVFHGPGGHFKEGDPVWEVRAFVDGKTGAVLEMQSVRGRTPSFWNPSP
ncbi:MAG: hypothetical protein AB7F50_05510 [Fimbriimonadaceae bacterium]